MKEDKHMISVMKKTDNIKMHNRKESWNVLSWVVISCLLTSVQAQATNDSGTASNDSTTTTDNNTSTNTQPTTNNNTSPTTSNDDSSSGRGPLWIIPVVIVLLICLCGFCIRRSLKKQELEKQEQAQKAAEKQK